MKQSQQQKDHHRDRRIITADRRIITGGRRIITEDGRIITEDGRIITEAEGSSPRAEMAEIAIRNLCLTADYLLEACEDADEAGFIGKHVASQIIDCAFRLRNVLCRCYAELVGVKLSKGGVDND